MFKKIFPTFLCVSALMAGGCNQQGTDNSIQPLAFETVLQAQQSGISGARAVAIQDDSAWEALWSDHAANVDPPPPVPAVDFTKKMVLGLFVGERPNLCYSVAIESVEKIGNQKVAVNYRETKSSGNCMPALAHPAHCVTVERLDLPVEFTELK
jgi:hypothetical protein